MISEYRAYIESRPAEVLQLQDLAKKTGMKVFVEVNGVGHLPRFWPLSYICCTSRVSGPEYPSWQAAAGCAY